MTLTVIQLFIGSFHRQENILKIVRWKGRRRVFLYLVTRVEHIEFLDHLIDGMEAIGPVDDLKRIWSDRCERRYSLE